MRMCYTIMYTHKYQLQVYVCVHSCMYAHVHKLHNLQSLRLAPQCLHFDMCMFFADAIILWGKICEDRGYSMKIKT